MKLTVGKYLNARQGSASTSAANPFYLDPATQVEIVAVEIGTDIEGNAIWYQDDTGHYYWSGGFLDSGFALAIFKTPKSFSGKNVPFEVAFLNSMLVDFISKYDDISILAAGIGETSYASLGIIVTLNRDIVTTPLSTIPHSVVYKGYSIFVEQQIKSAAKPNNIIYKDQKYPLVMGGSLENGLVSTFGTRGLKLALDNNIVILTCYHVGCYNLLKESKYSFDKSSIPIRFPAQVSQSNPTLSVMGQIIHGSLGNGLDYSLVQVFRPKLFLPQLRNGAIPNDYYSSFDISELVIGKVLTCHGCITHKSGKITKPFAAASFQSIDYDYVGRIKLSGLIETEDISVEGDSGAAVVDDKNKLVGILVGSDENRSYIMPYFKLLFKHKLTLSQS